MKIIKGLLFALVMLPSTILAADPDAADQEFYDKAAISGLFEVKASEVAAKRATNPKAKSFAEMMVADHSAANAKLKALAAQKKVVLPSALDKAHQNDLDKLNKAKPGKDFDEAYADLMEDGHDKAVKLFEDASKNAKDPDVSAFAAATLPTLRQHREIAEALDDEDVSP